MTSASSASKVLGVVEVVEVVEVVDNPSQGGQYYRITPLEDGAPQYARPHFKQCCSPPDIVSTEWED